MSGGGESNVAPITDASRSIAARNSKYASASFELKDRRLSGRWQQTSSCSTSAGPSGDGAHSERRQRDELDAVPPRDRVADDPLIEQDLV